MAVRATNNAWGSLSTAMSSQTTSLTLQAGQSARFPVLVDGSGDWFYITVTDIHGNVEIMKVTLTQGDQFTVVRAADGSVALSFDAASKVQLNVNVAFWTDFNADMDAVPYRERTFVAPFTLSGDPTAALHAATKQYMDAHFIAKTVAMMPPIGYTPVKQQDANKIYMGWDGTWLQLQANATYLGGAYTNLNFDPTSKANKLANCNYASGIYEPAGIDLTGAPPGNYLIQPGNPWVMMGYRQYYDGNGSPSELIYPHFVWLRNT
jgi:hypothetical protein